MPGSVLGMEWYSGEHYKVTASMDSKKNKQKKKNSSSDECSEEN